MLIKIIGLAIVALTAFTSAHALAGYDPSQSFSPTANPNGVWSYGWTQTLGSAFVSDTAHVNNSGLDFWEGPFVGVSPFDFPLVTHNGTAQTITYSTATWASGQLSLHPGPGDQYADLRFTAPANGLYSMSGSFYGLDVAPTTTDVHILVNGASVFSSSVNALGSGPSFNEVETMQAGDTIDFEVGYGSNGTYFNDTTGLSLNVAVPEPGSVSIIAVLTIGLLCRRRGKN